MNKPNKNKYTNTENRAVVTKEIFPIQRGSPEMLEAEFSASRSSWVSHGHSTAQMTAPRETNIKHPWLTCNFPKLFKMSSSSSSVLGRSVNSEMGMNSTCYLFTLLGTCCHEKFVELKKAWINTNGKESLTLFLPIPVCWGQLCKPWWTWRGPLSMTGILLPTVKMCHEGPQSLLIGSFLWSEKSQQSRLVLLVLISITNTQHEKPNLTV